VPLSLPLPFSVFTQPALDAPEDTQITLIHKEAPPLGYLELQICLGECEFADSHEEAEGRHRGLGVPV
jgi:hypothetical protein